MPKSKAKSPVKVKASTKVKDEEEIIGEPDEFLDEDRPHERLPVKIRIGESITEAQNQESADQDTVAPWEEAFAEGAEHGGEGAVCAHCGKVLGDREDEVVEREFDEEIMFFCSEKCARLGPAKPARH